MYINPQKVLIYQGQLNRDLQAYSNYFSQQFNITQGKANKILDNYKRRILLGQRKIYKFEKQNIKLSVTYSHKRAKLQKEQSTLFNLREIQLQPTDINDNVKDQQIQQLEHDVQYYTQKYNEIKNDLFMLTKEKDEMLYFLEKSDSKNKSLGLLQDFNLQKYSESRLQFEKLNDKIIDIYTIEFTMEGKDKRYVAPTYEGVKKYFTQHKFNIGYIGQQEVDLTSEAFENLLNLRTQSNATFPVNVYGTELKFSRRLPGKNQYVSGNKLFG